MNCSAQDNVPIHACANVEQHRPPMAHCALCGRSIVGVVLFLVLIAGMCMRVTAQDPPDLRPYSNGPLTGGDFKGKPPASSPHLSETVYNISLDRNVSTAGKTNPDGTITITTSSTGTPKAQAEIDRANSWIDPAHKNDKDLIDHEQGHMDLTEKNTRDLQSEYNKKQQDGEFTETKTLPKGTSAADVQKEIDAQQDRVLKKIDDIWKKKFNKNAQENQKYDDDTDHGHDDDAQKKARKEQRDALKAPNTKDDQKKGANAQSRSEKTVSFNATTGALTFSDDVIVGIDPLGSGFVPDLTDPALNAQVVLPDFALVGEQYDGTFFFTAQSSNPTLSVVASGTPPLLTTDLTYLVYDPTLNMFYGLGGVFDTLPGQSDFVDHMARQLTSGGNSLPGIEIIPDVPFLQASGAFAGDASAGFTNGLGARALAIPEPSSLTLVALGCLALALLLRAHRR